MSAIFFCLPTNWYRFWFLFLMIKAILRSNNVGRNLFFVVIKICVSDTHCLKRVVVRSPKLFLGCIKLLIPFSSCLDFSHDILSRFLDRNFADSLRRANEHPSIHSILKWSFLFLTYLVSSEGIPPGMSQAKKIIDPLTWKHFSLSFLPTTP